VKHAETIFEYREHWKAPVVVSGVLHVGLALGIVGYGIITGARGENWGGPTPWDSAINARLVSSAVPLPSTPTESENVLANESKGLSESKPVEKEPEPEAIPIPDKTTKTKPQPLPPTPKTKPAVKPTEQASNVIPYGQGGPTNFSYTMVKTTMGTGGVTLGNDGDFGSRYSWYVDAVRRKIADNWFKYEVDPSISNSRRVYLTFVIDRTGQPVNIDVSQSSGVPSLDISAKRALQRIDTFGPLPNDYRGSSVKVEFWFDYKK